MSNIRCTLSSNFRISLSIAHHTCTTATTCTPLEITAHLFHFSISSQNRKYLMLCFLGLLYMLRNAVHAYNRFVHFQFFHFSYRGSKPKTTPATMPWFCARYRWLFSKCHSILLLIIYHFVFFNCSSDAHSMSAQHACSICSFVSQPFHNAHRNALHRILPFFMGWLVIYLLRKLCVTIISQIYFLHTELSPRTSCLGHVVLLINAAWLLAISTQASVCLSSLSSCFVQCGQCMLALPNQIFTFPQVFAMCSSSFS